MKWFTSILVLVSLSLSSFLYGYDIVDLSYLSPEDPTLEGQDVVIKDGGVLEVAGEHSFASLYIESGGALTHPSGDAPENKIDLSITGDVTIDSGAEISVSGKGFPAQSGPGAGSGARADSAGGGGGAYGGNGGEPENSYYSGGVGYGSILEPQDLGSGGGHGFAGNGGAGGGRIKITAGGTFTNNGMIDAKGANGPVHYWGASGGGAGGSIWIEADSLAGTGSFIADGGNGALVSEEDSGGGGGGRIALYYAGSSFAGSISCAGGTSADGRCGGAGTICTKSGSDAFPQVLLDNQSRIGAESPLNPSQPCDVLITNSASAGLGDVLVSVNSITLENQGKLKNLEGADRSYLNIGEDGILKNTSQILANIEIDAQGSFTVEAGAEVSSNYLGFANQEGPGAGTGTRAEAAGGGGGAYGGNGGKPGSPYQGGTGYGSILQPNQFGSGGGDGYAGAGGKGGGSIKIQAAGAITVDGTVKANGAVGSSHYWGAAGGGAGGSIWLSADSLSGSGLIQANGGEGHVVTEEDGGAGGGGRIALYYAGSSFSGDLQAFGGEGSSIGCGGAGTIYLKNKNESEGSVVLNNNSNAYTSTIIETPAQFNLTVSSGAQAALENLFALNTLTVEAGGNVVNTEEMDHSEGTVSGDLTVQTDGSIQANADFNTGGDVIVETGGLISADHLGFANQEGPGAGTGTRAEAAGGGGGAYGGNGGKPGSPYQGGTGYGSIFQPNQFGSGGGDGYAGAGGKGGGRIKIQAAGAITVDGTVKANGAVGSSHYWGAAGGGAGGSIWLSADSLSGSGLIQANGGEGHVVTEEDGGAGGGGRIALYYNANTFAGNIEAFSGTGTSGNAGGAGTIYAKDKGQTYGLVTVDNNGVSQGLTHFETPEKFNLLVKNGGKAAPLTKLIADNVTLADGGIITQPSGSEMIEIAAETDFLIETGGQLNANASIETAGNLTIQPDGYIAADYRGFPNESGPGAGSGARADSAGGGGGAYGGFGGDPQSPFSGGAPYGDMYCPSDYGSGGGDGYAGSGGAGGGSLRVKVGGELSISGAVSSDGKNGPSHSWGAAGGGAGGSIWITAGSVTGSGLITANGGNGPIVSEQDGGGGSGGRIALYSADLALPMSNILAIGGSGFEYGEDGTVYTHSPADDLFVLSETSPTGVVDGYLSSLEISFSSPIQDSSFQPADVSITGPDGVVAASGISKSVSLSGKPVYRIEFPEQTAEGSYSFQIGPNISSQDGLLMNQNHNETAGEAIDYYSCEVTVSYLNSPELSDMMEYWLEDASAENFPQEYDYVDDDRIDLLDFAKFAENWLGRLSRN
ncbi:hypothetical protein [Sedimentisphaera salicampi]|uniref:SbsA Ig-like domain-containing protein n=1 Tax=Sedimentisphaera salicampi TaxID=1941349 RepID=A0A1W6LMF6_9BACT|nr:hypothetical protein [Sedimentisphaera salicampi]ARN56959.1 hypothetical protein STSP1_01352 [Sedimentisphaera salicampi]